MEIGVQNVRGTGGIQNQFLTTEDFYPHTPRVVKESSRMKLVPKLGKLSWKTIYLYVYNKAC